MDFNEIAAVQVELSARRRLAWVWLVRGAERWRPAFAARVSARRSAAMVAGARRWRPSVGTGE
jgi:hypothetical protein